MISSLELGSFFPAKTPWKRLLMPMLMALAVGLTACASSQPPAEHVVSSLERDQQVSAEEGGAGETLAETADIAGIDTSSETKQRMQDALLASIPLQTSLDGLLVQPLSPGDRLSFRMLDSTSLDGIYEVDANGELHFPYIAPIPAAGVPLKAVEAAVNDAYRQSGIMHPDLVRASLLIQRWAEVRAYVRGAVYRPGLATLELPKDEKTLPRLTISGHVARSRNLSFALKSAAGITPYARLDSVILTRNTKRYKFDLTGIFSGVAFPDPVLVDGDEIWVPEAAVLNTDYIRLSPVTPPGIKIAISNPTKIINQKSLDHGTREFAYGSRLIHAAATNACVGGANVDKNRRIALLQRHPGSREFIEFDTSASELLTGYQSEKVNPYLLPDAVVVCFDARTQNAGSVFDLLYRIALPISVIRGF